MNLAAFAVVCTRTGLVLGIVRGDLRRVRQVAGGSEVDLYSVSNRSAHKIECGDHRPLRGAEHFRRINRTRRRLASPGAMVPT
jgi:hypothetical protein